VAPYKNCPKCNNTEVNWHCKNCKLDVPKYKNCTKCNNAEDNWACTTCHMCNPTGNNMKRCGGGNNPIYWWYSPKYKACKCGNTEACWRCYNCDFNNPKYKLCKCGNQEDHWRCNNCNLDIAKYKNCKCGNKQWSPSPFSEIILLSKITSWHFGFYLWIDLTSSYSCLGWIWVCLWRDNLSCSRLQL